jgi:hypothetical protein
MENVKEHPLALLQPFDFHEPDCPRPPRTSPGKQDRIRVGTSKDGTAIYMRNPAGKIGEEFIGYMNGPLDMMRRKLGTIARPGWQILRTTRASAARSTTRTPTRRPNTSPTSGGSPRTSPCRRCRKAR